MDMLKIGRFLKELRNETGLAQETLAEKLGVSRRTVSRWETGTNMPDFDLLIEMSDLYKVDLREILDGERRGEHMDKEMKETVLQVAEYGNEEKKRITMMVRIYFIVGIVALIINGTMTVLELEESFWTGFIKGATIGLALVSMIMGIFYTTGTLEKVKAFKRRLLFKGGR